MKGKCLGDSLFPSEKLMLIVLSPRAEKKVLNHLYMWRGWQWFYIGTLWLTLLWMIEFSWLGWVFVSKCVLKKYCLNILVFKIMIFQNISVYFIFFIRAFRNMHLTLSWWCSSSLRALIIVLCYNAVRWG